jgi:DHA2 family multidrug resistance protein
MERPYLQGWHLLLLNIAIGLGTFIQVLDTSIANVALPYIAGNLNVSADEGTWVITSFAASNAIVLPLTGWLSNYFGSVRLFVWSVILFAIVSFFCGLSSNMSVLVTMRTLQGAVAGALIPLSQSLLLSHNPPKNQGVALGFWIIIVITAPILGPIVGGYLTQEFSWPWIFYINVPVGAISAFFTWYFLKDRETPIIRNPIDWVGLFLLTVGVGTLQIMLDKGKDLDWFESNLIITLTIVSIVSLIYFVIWNRFQKHPIVDFSIFRNINFAIGTLNLTLGYLFYFGSTVVIPLWLQTQQNYTPLWAGVAVAPIGLVPFLISLPLGAYLHRFDLRKLSALSFLLFSYGFYIQSNFTTQLSLESVMYTRFLQGFGVAIFFLPLLQISLSTIPKDQYANATGLSNFMRILIGSGFGTSLTIELWTRLEIFHHARLAETMTNSRSVVSDAYNALGQVGFNHALSTNIVDIEVTRQSFMLATNDISWLCAILFLTLIPLVFLCKDVRAAEGHVAFEA